MLRSDKFIDPLFDLLESDGVRPITFDDCHGLGLGINFDRDRLDKSSQDAVRNCPDDMPKIIHQSFLSERSLPIASYNFCPAAGSAFVNAAWPFLCAVYFMPSLRFVKNS